MGAEGASQLRPPVLSDEQKRKSDRLLKKAGNYQEDKTIKEWVQIFIQNHCSHLN